MPTQLYLLLAIFFSISSYAQVGTSYPKHAFSLDLNYQFYLHKKDFRVAEVYDINTQQQVNTNTYAPSIAKNRSGFSFGLNYERRFLKKRSLFVNMGLGYGKVNYAIGFRYNLSNFWNIPSLQNYIFDTLYQLEYPYIYADIKIGYDFVISKKISLGFWGGLQFNHFLEKEDLSNRWFIAAPYNGNTYVLQFASVSAIHPSFENFFSLKSGLRLSTLVLKHPIYFSLCYKFVPISKTETASWVNLRYYNVNSFNESTSTFNIGISGADMFMNTLRTAEFSININF